MCMCWYLFAQLIMFIFLLRTAALFCGACDCACAHACALVFALPDPALPDTMLFTAPLRLSIH